MDRNVDSRYVTKEVIVARTLWGFRYSMQMGGQVDFYEGLTDAQKGQCRRLVDEIEACKLRSVSRP